MKGPTRKEENVSKLAPRIDYEMKIGKMKRIASASFTSKTQTIPTTYDEAKASCKARKRKERQESISSLCQDRKVIRSNSEERPAQKKHIENKNNIRRVSSSEDLQKSTSIEKINVSPKRSVPSEKILAYEDHEYERRRCHERFARPLMLKKKHPNKRLKIRCISRTKFKPELPNDNKEYKKISTPQGTYSSECETTNKEESSGVRFLQLHEEERERSPSPTTLVSPVLDLTTLHEQVDCSEPLLSHTTRQINENTETLPSISIASNRLLSSPRNSIIATHRIYLDPDVPQMTSSLDKTPQNPVDERLQRLSKQINSLKKKIKKYEIEFESNYGFKPSHVEKMNDKAMKKFYTDLGKLRKEQKQMNEVSKNCLLISGNETEPEKTDVINLKDTIHEIDKRLAMKRDSANRSYNIEEMTSEQLLEEKVAIQKALLYLESIHGRPNSKEDRDIVRPFYDRYRVLKRMVTKISMSSTSGNELATIHENEAMNFVTPTSSSQSNDTESEKTTVLPSISTDSSDTDTSIGENLHSLSRTELFQQLKTVTEEKKELRRKIKEFEMETQLKTGRMIQKEDKAPMDGVYAAYKKTKAKVRLLEALVGKQN
ncbi:protein FAM13A [Anoplophora glabripennis]|uniref:protein FAM13A n=1 Tax=Anoplophora glabripennis TaxID=217634 RepID=UPI000875A56B|nr:protein FAM13A [Anoplophora glabripennis]